VEGGGAETLGFLVVTEAEKIRSEMRNNPADNGHRTKTLTAAGAPDWFNKISINSSLAVEGSQSIESSRGGYL
jgi:hypothetical protein